MKPYENVQVKNNARSAAVEETVSEKMSTALLSVTGMAGAVVGLWSFATLIGALVTAGGPLGVATGYFKAVSGL